MNPASDDPAAILDGEKQWTEPWGGSDHGSACEKCRRSGVTDFCCWSCLLTSATPECPACAGRVRWSDICPVCRGNRVVDGQRRRGISVYPRLEGLYHYMLAKDAELDNCLVVELEARCAPDVDFDADAGALLVLPTLIRGCAAPSTALMERVRERAPQLDEPPRD